MMQREHARSTLLSPQLGLHVGKEMELLERASHSAMATELVVAPVELHQRNIQRRLREAGKPKHVFEFDDPAGVSRDVLNATDVVTEATDRIDRLALVRALLDDSAASEVPTISLPVGIDTRDPQHIEQIRTEIETVTNFHPERIAAWKSACVELNQPVDTEAAELLDTAIQIERILREQTTKALSETELIRKATRELMETDGTAWTNAFPDIERLSLVGLSSISATLADFVHALVATTPINVHVHFRAATGEYLTDRLPSLLGVSSPGKVVFE